MVDAAETTINYTYDAKGRLKTTTIEDDASTTISMTYDNLGHKIRMIDPDLGTWYYKSNALGELTRQIDAKHNNTFIAYLLGRVIQKSTLKGGTQEWKHDSWIYDTKVIGALSQVVSGGSSQPDITKSYSYDTNLRPINKKVTIYDVSHISYTRFTI